MPCNPSDVHVASLEVEPTYLAHVHVAMWQNADVEMQKLGCRACGSHDLADKHCNYAKQIHCALVTVVLAE